MSQMNLSRFADPNRTKTVDLGECSCPGTPHPRDTAEVRADIGAGEFRSALQRGGWADGSYNGSAGDSELIATFTRSWTLLGADGEAVPITFDAVHLLDEATRDQLAVAIGESHREGSVPKASGGPSPDSSPGTGSPSRKAPRRR